jgi:biotin carboxyl carrier protein
VTRPATGQRRSSAEGAQSISAPMPATVVKLLVKPGDAVKKGDTLVVLEAMKMEHALSVPAAARVKAVHVAPGVQVAPGHLLIELEPAS